MQNVRALPSTLEIVKARARSSASIRADVLVAVLLLGIMLLGGYFRFVGLNWDDFTHLHPDERFLTGVASSLGGGLNLTEESDALKASIFEDCLSRYPDTNGVGGFFDARCSTLNPHNTGNPMYVYGTLPLFIARGAAEITRSLSESWAAAHGDLSYNGSVWTDYYGVHLVWRAVSALAEIGVILLVFLIGLTLHDKWIGLLAAFLYASAVFSIQLAHFGTADAVGNFFCTLAILFAVLSQKEGKLINYIWFGIALGAALASRINLAPLAALIVVAAAIRALPALHKSVAWGERERLIAEAVIGVALAGVFTLLAFRMLNPYAFNGPGFFGLSINQRWLDDLNKSRDFVSGAIDFPPNYQWASRTQWLYPLKDMVLWGMGAAFGVVGWLSFAFAGWRIVRGRAGALLNALPFVWILGYFGYMGAQWVMVIRYYIPLYPVLAILAAWGLITLLRNARVRQSAWRTVLAWGLIVTTVGFTLLWAAMYTHVYRHQLTRVQASYWVWENVPSDFAMRINDAPADTPLVQIALPQCSGSDNLLQKATCFNDLNRRWSSEFVAPASGEVTELYAPHLGNPLDTDQEETLRFTVFPNDQPDQLLVDTSFTNTFPRSDHILGNAYTIPLDEPLILEVGQRYTMNVELVTGDALVSGGSVFSWEGAWDDPVPIKVCEMPIGTTLADEPPPGLVSDPRECNGLDPWWGLVNGYELNIVYEDMPEKRQNLITYLNDSDFIAISSNRFYDSMSRNTQRWPMTQVYYQALFDGSFGFDLVAQFDETFELGPLRVSDQYLPNYTSPAWLNEFESDEAFSVYDHPAVFIFQKRDDYDPSQVARILYDVPLNRVSDGGLLLSCPGVMTYYCDSTLINVNPIGTSEINAAPTWLRFTDDMWQIQTNGGTWSERFNTGSILNTSIVGAVAGWWIAILLFGFAAFPLLFVAFPGLADRGYAVSKFVGMLLVGWGTWFLASARIEVWNQGGIAAGLFILFALGVFMIRRTRAPIGQFIKAHWKRLVVIELLTLALFAAFVLVRLSNPDLWHPAYGGEKPMDFAYFNGVLRSTIFPPIDPWNSGGFINYYYFGFVIVGTPVLLLKMIPAVAYNLILPTLFAATGIGAFSVAFSTVNAWRERRESAAFDQPEGDESSGDEVVKRERSPRIASMWLAGIAAMFLVVVLGNLDTPRVFLTGIARMGGFDTSRIERGLQGFLIDEFVTQNQRAPNDSEMSDLLTRADANDLFDRVRYETYYFGDIVGGVGRGIGRILNGDRLDISADRWFWGPSRVYAELPPSGSQGGAITEMPYFTFIYGDLHAHMISMPLQLFGMLFILHEVVTAATARRRTRWLALVLGGIAIGMMRATNTWDWITYMVFAVVGLGFAWVMRLRTFKWTLFSRRTLLNVGGTVGGFVGVALAAAIPYVTWFVTTYSRVLPWQDGKAPLWGYLTIHGLFIFVLVSLLLWDTARWLRATPLTALRGKYLWLSAGALIALGVLLAAFALTVMGTEITILVLPLIAWVAILILRKGQTLPMQFVLAAAGLALALTLAVDYVVLDGDIGRQNTVFKFYLQAWLLFGVVGGVGIAVLMRHMGAWKPVARTAWSTVLIVLVAVAAMFPIMATLGKSIFRFDQEQPLTLNGMDYMQYGMQYEGSADVLALYSDISPFPLSSDYYLIRWMQDNLQGSPVIIEGASEPSEYKWDARVAINTGLPSVIGWNWHQRQQRTLDNMGRQVEMRFANVNAFYQTTDIDTAMNILRFYGVQYIVVSDMERAYYQPQGLNKLAAMVTMGYLDIAYDQNGATLYHVSPGAYDRLRAAQTLGMDMAVNERG